MSADDPGRRRHVVQRVEGRGSPGSPKGLPLAARMLIDGPLGTMNLRVPQPPGVKVAGSLRAVVEGGRFSHCPICLVRHPDSREHVPQQGLGGKVMTYTCVRCNNGFGTRVEGALYDLHARAFDVRVSSPLLPGSRSMARFLLRENDEGTPVHLQGRGRTDPEVEAIFDQLVLSGDAEFTYRLPDPRAVRAALLKHAYIAACMAIREVPMDGYAAEIRAELLAARDTPRRQPLPDAPHAKG